MQKEIETWTIYVQPYDGKGVEEIEIKNTQTFGEFRKKASEQVKISFNDLLLVGKKEYNGNYNSKKMNEIEGIFDQCSLYAVYSVNGGEL